MERLVVRAGDARVVLRFGKDLLRRLELTNNYLKANSDFAESVEMPLSADEVLPCPGSVRLVVYAKKASAVSMRLLRAGMEPLTVPVGHLKKRVGCRGRQCVDIKALPRVAGTHSRR